MSKKVTAKSDAFTYKLNSSRVLEITPEISLVVTDEEAKLLQARIGALLNIEESNEPAPEPTPVPAPAPEEDKQPLPTPTPVPEEGTTQAVTVTDTPTQEATTTSTTE